MYIKRRMSSDILFAIKMIRGRFPWVNLLGFKKIRNDVSIFINIPKIAKCLKKDIFVFMQL